MDLNKKIIELLDNPAKIKKVCEEIAKEHEECKKAGHPNTTYLWTENESRSDITNDIYQCKNCGEIIKIYNHEATLRYREALNTPCTI